MTTLPQTAKRLLRVEKVAVILAPGEEKTILDDREAGYLSQIIISTNSADVLLRLCLDEHWDEVKISQLSEWGIYDYIPEHFYAEKYDTATPLFVVAYISPNYEQYNKRITFILKNEGAGAATINYVRIKRFKIKEYLR